MRCLHELAKFGWIVSFDDEMSGVEVPIGNYRALQSCQQPFLAGMDARPPVGYGLVSKPELSSESAVRCMGLIWALWIKALQALERGIELEEGL